MSRPTRNPSGRSRYCLISVELGGRRIPDFSGLSFHVPAIRGVALVARACPHGNEITMCSMAETAMPQKVRRLREFMSTSIRSNHEKTDSHVSQGYNPEPD